MAVISTTGNTEKCEHAPSSNLSVPARQRRRPSPVNPASSVKDDSALNSSSTISAKIAPSKTLLAFHEIPEWYQDNEHIVHGYRPPSNSTLLCFKSWMYIHNETFNILSHLIPSLLAAICGALLHGYFLRNYPAATDSDKIVFAFFLLTTVACLTMSSVYHTMMNHSASVSRVWLRLDYVGIVLQTLGDFVSGIYLVFYCEPALQKVYWAMVTAFQPLDFERC